MTMAGIGVIGLLRPRLICGDAASGFATWLASRWDVHLRGRVGGSSPVFRKDKAGRNSGSLNFYAGSQTSLAATHAHFRLGLNLQFAQFIEQRAAGAAMARIAKPAARRNAPSRNVFSGAYLQGWSTLNRWMQHLIASGGPAVETKGMQGGRPDIAFPAGPLHTRLDRAEPFFHDESKQGDRWMWTRLVNLYNTISGANRLTVVYHDTVNDPDSAAASMTTLARTLLSRSENRTWLGLPLPVRRDVQTSAAPSQARNGSVPLTAAQPSHRNAGVPAPFQHSAPPITLAHAKPSPRESADLKQSLAQIEQALHAIQPRQTAAAAVDIPHLTRQVYSHLERELRIEKERRGL